MPKMEWWELALKKFEEQRQAEREKEQRLAEKAQWLGYVLNALQEMARLQSDHSGQITLDEEYKIVNHTKSVLEWARAEGIL